ncbi:hypothetical protein [Brevundimonas sp.]|uniref:tetratricopeptide repeat protein n=1 Tax=Brevundimonas sp. TaxID=1871086 RepID=UPI00262943E9|nr:hypothetical protein [Brevundimonas sp.]
MLTALAIWLGWQIVTALVVQRAPPESAVRIAPGSAQALSRAAEAELVAERPDQAADLAILTLRAAPFDLRALRVLGLVRARTDETAADELLTLAGNWSLRDDPSHAWLMNRRLRVGDYVGAYGHADTLARRRVELRPTLFRFFTTAAALDPRAMPVLIDRFGVMPNWRGEYLEYLRTQAEGPQIQAALAVAVNDRRGRMSDTELEAIYYDWAATGRLPGLRALRTRLSRPPLTPLHDGEFDDPPGPAPFRWVTVAAAGLSASLSEDGSRDGQKALLVETDGFGISDAAVQLLMLDPGPHVFSAAWRTEVGEDEPRMTWTLTCVESGQTLFSWTPDDAREWRRRQEPFVTPSVGCTMQRLRLTTSRGERRSTIVVWFDHFQIDPGTVKSQEN